MQDATPGGRLAHLVIRARNAKAARRFYEHGIGLCFLGFRRPRARSFDLSDGALNVTVIPYEGPPREPHEEGTALPLTERSHPLARWIGARSLADATVTAAAADAVGAGR